MFDKILKLLGIKRKCVICCGSGEYYSEGMARDIFVTEGVKCGSCNGTGKVKRY